MKRAGLKNICLRAAAVLLVLVMFSSCLLSGLLARYASSKSGGNGIQAAAFKVEPGSEYSSSEFVLESMLPGQSRSFDFTITTDSEVTVKCAAEIESTENLPLTFTVKQDGTPVPLDNIYTFEKGNTTAQFTLTVSWDESDNDIKYTDEIDVFRLVVIAEQVD